MTEQFNNPFAGSGLIIPETQRDFYDQYCRTQTVGQSNIDRRPFERMIDLWFAGFAFAVRKQLKYDNPKKEKSVQFNTGVVFDGKDSWRIQFIMLVAIEKEGSLEIVKEPSKMIDIANSLAAVGVPQIVAMLRSGSQEPIWNLSEALDEYLQSENSEDGTTSIEDVLI